MRTYFLIIGVLSLSLSCNNAPRSSPNKTDTLEVITSGIPDIPREPSMETGLWIKKYILDSILPEMKVSDDIVRNPPHRAIGYAVYTNIVNEHRIALIGITFSTGYLFEYSNSKWIQRDSFQYNHGIYKITVTDINGDGNNDINISSVFDTHMNLLSFILLADKNGQLHYTTGGLTNVEFDTANRILKSYYCGSNTSNQKEISELLAHQSKIEFLSHIGNVIIARKYAKQLVSNNACLRALLDHICRSYTII